MEKTPLVSIIVPVYNVEAYLPKMIDSVLAQTFTDYELILVDDESPDRCGRICDEASGRDERIRVIHKKNGGCAAARNTGMETARGKYFFFVDSDDWIEPEMLATLVKTAEKYQSMLTFTGYCMEYFEGGKASSYDVSPEPAVYLTAESFRQNAYKYFDQTFLAFAWNKLYLSMAVRESGMCFPEDIRQWEDFTFNMDYLMDVSSVVVVPGAMYHYYRSRPGAAGTVISIENMLYSMRKYQFELILRLYQHWDIHDVKSMGTIHGYYVSRLLQCIQETTVLKGMSGEEKRKQVSMILSDEQTKKSLVLARPESGLMRVAILPMKWGSVRLCILEGKVISFVKERMANEFYHLRAKVVNKGSVRKRIRSNPPGGGYIY